MNNIDRVVRILIAITIAVLYYMNILPGIWATILLVVAGVFILTSFVSFCPIYWGLGLSTRKKSA